MYYRRKLFLSLLKKLDKPVNFVELQKFLFLISLRQDKPRTYDFVPNKYGCYSFTVHTDQKILESQGFISFIPDKNNKIFSKVILNNSALDNLDIVLKGDDSAIVSSVVRKYGNLTTPELVNIAYKERPFYTIYSEWIERMGTDEEFQRNLKKSTDIIKSAPRALYTIGYEGLNIESFILKLIGKNIKMVIDVRKNPISMKKDFSKSRLRKYLGEVNIEYTHIPKVGIPTEIRNEYLPTGRRMELFKWYEDNILPLNTESIDEIIKSTATQNVALLCFEKNPLECHRTHLAYFCNQFNNEIPVQHIL
ncbi:MAG: hypothetical protein CVV46_06070 [Spirochaetae bacterium HGW-Spirochaetae-2]|jgi:uncharacterized protein YwgA|nr:MAG: hypothetical protein CVV46_06070 [Spirochaetae bacterium HGW-Spirochaetae-2]